MELNEFLKAIQEAKLYKNMIFANMDSEERICTQAQLLQNVLSTCQGHPSLLPILQIHVQVP